jgi:hypothetical protein
VYFFGLLMLLDIIFLVVILMLESIYPSCTLVEPHCECTPHDMCVKTCLEPPHSVENALIALNALSFAIISVFLIEILFQIYLIGICRFLRHPSLMFDLVVVVGFYLAYCMWVECCGF